MSIIQNKTAFVDPPPTIGMSQMFTVAGSAGNPAYLVVTVLDRNEYTKGSTGATGTLSGNGHTLNMTGIGGDGRGAGAVFAYQPSSGRYYNSSLGYFDQLVYTSSANEGDVASLSLFGTSNYSLAVADAANAYMMMQADANGYLGSATFVTQASFAGPVPAQATPNSIASVAAGFIGHTWNASGCWVLASTIAAEAGAALPVESSMIGVPGQTNGEWIVAFNGPAGQSANWQTMVTAGEVVVIGTQDGGGHITTCVSGAGSTAMLVDNASFIGANARITNAANDGSANDIVIAAPHAASREWAGVQASSVVIYELDTPVVSIPTSPVSVAYFAAKSLASMFSAADPAGKAIMQWQVYDTAASDTLTINGVAYNYHSASSALTAASLSGVSLLAGSISTNDILEARAYNGTYWGDWQPLSVAITPSAAPSAPAVTQQTPDQTWTMGEAISLVLPSNTFTDPQGQRLICTAAQSNGQPLPGWLDFNTTTDCFSGTALATGQSLSIKVTATDTSGLSASETFTAAIQGPPPPRPGIIVSSQTPSLTWTDGQSLNLVLPASTFTDALGLKMTFAAYEMGGPNMTSWLRFNPVTDAFIGDVPAHMSGTIGLAVIARDAMNVTAADMFSVTFAAGTVHSIAETAPGMIGIDPLANSPSPFGLMALHA